MDAVGAAIVFLACGFVFGVATVWWRHRDYATPAEVEAGRNYWIDEYCGVKARLRDAAVELEAAKKAARRLAAEQAEVLRLRSRLAGYDRCTCGWNRTFHEKHTPACKGFVLAEPADDLETVVAGDPPTTVSEMARSDWPEAAARVLGARLPKAFDIDVPGPECEACEADEASLDGIYREHRIQAAEPERLVKAAR